MFRRAIRAATAGTGGRPVGCGDLAQDRRPVPAAEPDSGLICKGKPNKLIAYEMQLAEATVKAHITALLRRLEVQNRTQAAHDDPGGFDPQQSAMTSEPAPGAR